MIWDLQSGNPLHELGSAGTYDNAVLSPNGEKVATFITTKNIVEFWDARSGKMLPNVEQRLGGAFRLTKGEFNADSKRFLALKGGEVILWDTNSGKVLQTFGTKKGNMTNAKFNPVRADILLTVDEKEVGQVKLWSTERKRPLRNISTGNQAIKSAEFSPNGDYMVVTNIDKKIFVIEVKSGDILRQWTYPDKGIVAATMSPDSKTVLTTASGKTLLWDVETQGLRFIINSGGSTRKNASFYSSDGSKIITFSDEDVRLWQLRGSSDADTSSP